MVDCPCVPNAITGPKNRRKWEKKKKDRGLERQQHEKDLLNVANFKMGNDTMGHRMWEDSRSWKMPRNRFSPGASRRNAILLKL